MIKEYKCYTLLCDNCGLDVNEIGDHSGYINAEDNYEIAEEEGWEQIEEKWYCMNCYVYDEQLNKFVVNPTEVKND